MRPIFPRPLENKNFTLDVYAVAGLFGGNEAIAAMATVHLFRARRWLGWYNSPGSYTVAKRFGQIASGRMWDGLFPGPNETPAISFGLDGRAGPKYVASLSGTEMQTGHLGYLVMQRAREEQDLRRGPRGFRGDDSHAVWLELKSDVDDVFPQNGINALFAAATILANIAGCLVCALVADWYCFVVILLGILSSGFACLVIGSGQVTLDTGKVPAEGSPSGDGILIGKDTIVVVRGTEKNVNAITKGKFVLRIQGAPTYHLIGCCSFLLLLQFLCQLLLIPQGTLFGQTMFLGTLVVSWAYNSYLSSLEKEKIQTDGLITMLGGPPMRKTSFEKRTAVAVFACLSLTHETNDRSSEVKNRILLKIVPNDTEVWRRWRRKVTEHMEEGRSPPGSLAFLELNEDDRLGLGEEEIELFGNLLGYARSAFDRYHQQHPQSPTSSPALPENGIVPDPGTEHTENRTDIHESEPTTQN